MPRFVAFLRGVSPLNAKSADLKHAFETAGFTNVRTVLSSGNVVFDANATSEPRLEQAAEAALQQTLGRTFYTIVRSTAHLQELLKRDPYQEYAIPKNAKRVVSFLREAPEPKVPLPLVLDNAQVLCIMEREVFTAYVAVEKGPVFMQLIERTFGTNITTRALETVKKCAQA